MGGRSELLRWLGPSRYTVSSIIEILSKKNRKAKLIIDDQTLVGEFSFVVGCNSIHIGNGMKMAPHAKLNDGLIDLLVVTSDITRKRLFLFSQSFLMVLMLMNQKWNTIKFRGFLYSRRKKFLKC